MVAKVETYKSLEVDLTEFVELANTLLPDYLPDEIRDQRFRSDVTPRLVRHYATQGLLEEPLKDGRNAVYTYRHLLQLLLLRRLIAEGYSSSAIDTLPLSRDNQELEELLQIGEVTESSVNPALAFLESLRSGTPVEKAPSKRARGGEEWTRFEIGPGFEIHLRGDYRFPQSSHARTKLLQDVESRLKKFGRSNHAKP